MFARLLVDSHPSKYIDAMIIDFTWVLTDHFSVVSLKQMHGYFFLEAISPFGDKSAFSGALYAYFGYARSTLLADFMFS